MNRRQALIKALHLAANSVSLLQPPPNLGDKDAFKIEKEIDTITEALQARIARLERRPRKKPQSDYVMRELWEET